MKKMSRELLATLCILVAAVLAGVFIYLLSGRNISGDTWIQYVGATLGGIATMLGVMLTIGVERKHYDDENRPQIRLTLSDYCYFTHRHKFFSYFGGKFDTNIRAYISHPDNVLPLQIENFGKSDVFISGIQLIRNGESTSYNHSDGQPATFCIFSQESIDIPFRINFEENDKAPLQIKISYRRETDKQDQTKQYSLYIPRENATTEEDYRNWVRQINISKARNSV